jgi:hypothetical protein
MDIRNIPVENLCTRERGFQVIRVELNPEPTCKNDSLIVTYKGDSMGYTCVTCNLEGNVYLVRESGLDIILKEEPVMKKAIDIRSVPVEQLVFRKDDGEVIQYVLENKDKDCSDCDALIVVCGHNDAGVDVILCGTNGRCCTYDECDFDVVMREEEVPLDVEINELKARIAALEAQVGRK